MSLTPEQQTLIRQYSRDDDAYQQLLELFNEVTEQGMSSSDRRMVRTILDAIPDRIYVKDRESKFILANEATWQFHKLPNEQALIGKSDIDLFGDTGRTYFEGEQEVLKSGHSLINYEHEIPKGHPGAERPYTLITKVPLRDETGAVIGLIGINRDITDLKRVQAELHHNQQFGIQVSLAIPDVIFVYDLIEQTTIYCNEQIITVLGYTPDQVRQMGSDFLPTVMHPQDWLRQRDHVRRYQKMQDSDVVDFEYRMQHIDGSWRWLFNREMIFQRGDDGTPTHILGVCHDISERKRSEEALRQSEAQKNALINAIPDMITELDKEGKVLNIKLRAGMMSAFPLRRYIGQSLDEMYPPEIAEPIVMLVKRALTTGQLQTLEYESPFTNTNALREARIVAIDQERAMVISRDITEPKTMEKSLLEQERLQVALQKEQELSLLKSRMMSRISHEFRTPLSVILTSNELLWHYNGRMTPEQRQDHFQRIRDEIQNMSEILKSISLIVQIQSQQRALEMYACDLGRLCQETIGRLQAEGGVHRHLEMTADGDLQLCPADEHLLERMIQHLLANAVKFSTPGSRIHLDLRRRDDEIILRVTDQGIGIPESDQPRLFEPFFRGSNIGEVSGIGLGLPLIKHAVDLHDGRIVIDSLLGRGTTVTIHLPAMV